MYSGGYDWKKPGDDWEFKFLKTCHPDYPFCVDPDFKLRPLRYSCKQ